MNLKRFSDLVWGFAESPVVDLMALYGCCSVCLAAARDNSPLWLTVGIVGVSSCLKKLTP